MIPPLHSTDNADTTIASLYADGQNQTQIAKAVGSTQPRVSETLKRLGS